MTPDLYWIPGPWKGRLAISGRPREGDWLEDEVRGWRDAGVNNVVSLLEKDEERQLDLGDEERLVNECGIRFTAFPISDRGIPPSLPAAVSQLLEVNTALERGQNVAIHCRQGIGRSALVAAGTLMTAGTSPEDAIRAVGLARGLNVPETREQRKWLTEELADSLAVGSSLKQDFVGPELPLCRRASARRSLPKIALQEAGSAVFVLIPTRLKSACPCAASGSIHIACKPAHSKTSRMVISRGDVR